MKYALNKPIVIKETRELRGIATVKESLYDDDDDDDMV
jgi:hypothetical protein